MCQPLVTVSVSVVRSPHIKPYRVSLSAYLGRPTQASPCTETYGFTLSPLSRARRRPGSAAEVVGQSGARRGRGGGGNSPPSEGVGPPRQPHERPRYHRRQQPRLAGGRGAGAYDVMRAMIRRGAVYASRKGPASRMRRECLAWVASQGRGGGSRRGRARGASAAAGLRPRTGPRGSGPCATCLGKERPKWLRKGHVHAHVVMGWAA